MSDHDELMQQARRDVDEAAEGVEAALTAVRMAHQWLDARKQGQAEQLAHKAIADLDWAISYLGHLRIRESERLASLA